MSADTNVEASGDFPTKKLEKEWQIPRFDTISIKSKWSAIEQALTETNWSNSDVSFGEEAQKHSSGDTKTTTRSTTKAETTLKRLF